MEDRLLRPGQVAARLGVTVDTLRRYEQAGQLPSIVLPSGQRRYPTSAVERIVNGTART